MTDVLDGVSFDDPTRVRIGALLRRAEPRYQEVPGSRHSILELLAGGPPPELFYGASEILASKLGLDLGRGPGHYQARNDVCERAPAELVVLFLWATYQHLSSLPHDATPLPADTFQDELNVILEEHDIPIRMRQGAIVRANPLETPTGRMEDKFGILLSASQACADFSRFAEGSRARGMPITLLFIDVDNFKLLNDRYTETVVDRTILGPLQEALKDMVELRGTAYRHGGEEFVVILPNHDLGEGRLFAERLRRAIGAVRFLPNDSEETITISIGIASAPDHGHDYNQVLEAANRAKHSAKARGRNRVEVAEAVSS